MSLLPAEVDPTGASDPFTLYIRTMDSDGKERIFGLDRAGVEQTFPDSLLASAIAEQPTDEVIIIDLHKYTPELISWIAQWLQGQTTDLPFTLQVIGEAGKYLNIDFFGVRNDPLFTNFAQVYPNLTSLNPTRLEEPSNYRSIIGHSIINHFPALALYTFATTDPSRHQKADEVFLVRAAAEGEPDIVAALLERGINPVKGRWAVASPRLREVKGSQAFYYAILNNHDPIIAMLLEDERIDPTADGHLAVLLAQEQQNFPLLQRLLADPRVNVAEWGPRFLHAAVFMSLPGVITFLQPYVTPEEMQAALVQAVVARLPISVRAILAVHPIDVGNEALITAMTRGYDEIVDLLIELGAEREVLPAALEWAAFYSQKDWFERLKRSN